MQRGLWRGHYRQLPRNNTDGNEERWRSTLARTIDQAIECGHLRPGDTGERVFELYAIALALNHESGLFGHELARRHADAATERWIASNTP